MAVAHFHEAWVDLIQVVIEEDKKRGNASNAVEVVGRTNWFVGRRYIDGKAAQKIWKHPDEGAVELVQYDLEVFWVLFFDHSLLR